MEAFLTYLLKSAGLLSIFYLAYIILLRKETSFQINRRFLMGGILTSAVLPAIYFTRKVMVEANNFFFHEFPASTNITSENIASNFGAWEVLGLAYLSVALSFLTKIFVQLFNIWQLIKKSQIHKIDGFNFLTTNTTVSPFSFFKFIVYNPAAHSEKDLQMILQHEKIHAAQWHSIDILIANLTTALLWFNPLSWLYKKSVEQNLEYIADRETVAISGAKKSYQQALVKVSISNLQPALTNHFYQSFIKKRILMLNKKSSQNTGLWKLSLVFPFVLAFMLAFNVKTKAQTKKSENPVETVQVNKSVSATITKFSKEEGLEKISGIFQKFNVELEFSEIKYSNELLTGIKVSFLNKETNETGTFSTNDTEGIESFEIFTDKKETGFRKANTLLEKGAISSNGSALGKLGKHPLYIIDSKKYTSKELDGKHLDISKQGISISLAEEAKAKYGNEAEDGAIIANNARIIDNLQNELKRIDKEDSETKREFLQIEHGRSPSLISLQTNFKGKKKNKNKKLRENSKNPQEIPGDPLYILNGEKSKKEIVELIDKDLIKSVNVLKGENATSLYGKDAKDGAVIITTGVLDKSKKKTEKKVIKTQAHSVGFQTFKKKTDYEIITGKSLSFSNSKDINAFHKYEEDKKSDNSTGYTVKANIFTNGHKQASPLVIIDGKKESAEFMEEKLQPEDVEKINVLKGTVALEKYGEDAEVGVIEITTKKDKK